MIVIWTMFLTFLVAEPLTAVDSKYYAERCAMSGGSEVHIGGNFGANPKEPHTARLVECKGEPAEAEEPEIKHDA